MKACVFAYHNIGIIGIDALIRYGFEIPLVFTHDDNPEENIWFGSVVKLCKERSIEYVTPETPNSPPWIEKIKAISPDIIFSFYYRHMISKDILAIPKMGAYNLHGSLLPAYRGRCPVNWVLINGEEYTGVSLHEMVEKPDAGSIVAQKKVEILFEDTALTLYGRLEDAARSMLDKVLPDIRNGRVKKVPQDLSRGSYYGGRTPEDSRIDWGRPAIEIYNLIRAVTRPYPGAFGFLHDKKIIFWWGLPYERSDITSGMIYIADDKVSIGTGSGIMSPHEIEIDGLSLKGDSMLKFFKDHKGECLK